MYHSTFLLILLSFLGCNSGTKIPQKSTVFSGTHSSVLAPASQAYVPLGHPTNDLTGENIIGSGSTLYIVIEDLDTAKSSSTKGIASLQLRKAPITSSSTTSDSDSSKLSTTASSDVTKPKVVAPVVVKGDKEIDLDPSFYTSPHKEFIVSHDNRIYHFIPLKKSLHALAYKVRIFGPSGNIQIANKQTDNKDFEVVLSAFGKTPPIRVSSTGTIQK